MRTTTTTTTTGGVRQEVELLFRPYPGLVRFPSYEARDPYEDDAFAFVNYREIEARGPPHEEDVYTAWIRSQIIDVVARSIHSFHCELADRHSPLTEDMGESTDKRKWK